jgi:hypothetical protein
MKLSIKRPSEYIRYTDNELTEVEATRNEEFARLCDTDKEFRDGILEDAAPVWNEAFVK